MSKIKPTKTEKLTASQQEVVNLMAAGFKLLRGFAFRTGSWLLLKKRSGGFDLRKDVGQRLVAKGVATYRDDDYGSRGEYTLTPLGKSLAGKVKTWKGKSL